MTTAVVAVGGNSLVATGETGRIDEQRANARRTSAGIVRLMQDGCSVIVTHGNGPQVGAALLRSERAASHVYRHTLDVCVATTQGEIGYVLQQALAGEMAAAGLQPAVVTVLSQVVVSGGDPALRAPTKPVGPFLSHHDAERARDRDGWHVVEDASRGWRRVVPSPEPIEIVEEQIIGDLFRRGVVVIALGGGGVPVVRDNGRLRGIEAVIDKDAASALLASRLRVDRLIISTDTDRVYLNYRQPGQRPIDRIAAEEIRRYRDEGHFPPGNMGPKIDAALRFLAAGGTEAIVTCCGQLAEAVHGSAGTHILP